MSLLKNPMILIAVVGMGMMFGMPYLLDNSEPLFLPSFVMVTGACVYTNDIPVDPETRQEFEEAQKSGPLAGVTAATNPMQGFDMAAWMAGSGAKHTTSTAVEEAAGARNRRRG